MNQILKNIITRRSVRSFTDQRINREELDQILQAAIYAPSGNNRQSWHFTVLQNKDKMNTLANVIARHIGRDVNSYNFYQADTLILSSNEQDNGNGLADCACAQQNIFLMAHALGIGSVWINQLKTICNEPEVRSVLNDLGVPENHIVWGMAALGYPAAVPEGKERKEGTVHYVD